MRHRASLRFWKLYYQLTPELQRQADKAFELIKRDSQHPSLHFKKVGKYWSARINQSHRAVAIESGSDLLWFWIGNHDDYEDLIAD